jgi:hypothetical protein
MNDTKKVIAWLEFHICDTCEKNYSTVGSNNDIHAGCLGLIEDIALIREMPESW